MADSNAIDFLRKVKMKNVLGKTQAEVKEKLKIKLEESKVLDVAKSESYTVAEWAALWFEVYAKDEGDTPMIQCQKCDHR